MAEIKETVTTSQDSGVSETGADVQQETRKVDTQVAVDGKTTASNIVWYAVGLIEVLLAFRLVMKALGANPSSGFVDFLYAVTSVLIAPFTMIFNVATPATGDVVGSVFEPSILVAAVIYALLGWGIVKLLNLNRPAAAA